MKRWIHASTVQRHASSVAVGQLVAEEDDPENFKTIRDIKPGKDSSVLISFDNDKDYINYLHNDIFYVQQ